MKKIFLLLTIALPALSSCNKLLDTEPNGAIVPENAYASAAQIRAAVTGIYTNLKYGVNYANAYSAMYTAPTDEAYYYNQTGFANFAATANDGTTNNPNNMWRACYQSINYANSLLDNIDASAAGKVSADTVRRAKGEALFLRGFYYFILAQWWGDVPLQLHATSDPSQGQIPRTPIKQVYQQVIADMTQADSLLYDQTYTTQGYTDRITRTGIQGMLARVNLYMAGQPVNDKERYKDVIYWCNKVISSGEHGLMSTYPQVFIDESRDVYNKENMFEIGSVQNAVGLVSSSLSTGIIVGVPMTLSDSNYVNGYLKLHPRQYFKYEPGDYRRDWNIGNYFHNNTAIFATSNNALTLNEYSGTTVGVKTPLPFNRLWSRHPAKWRREYESAVSRSFRTGNSTNYPVLRYADVLLMLAEAENELNGPTTIAFDALNQVRRRSISPTRIVDSLQFVVGTGYTSTPAVTYTRGDGTGFAFNAIYIRATGATSGTFQVLLTGQGSGYNTVAPTITIGNKWTTGTAYTVGTQVAAPNGLLYTVTANGTATATPPTNTSGASSAAATGAVFTYAGVAATAVAYLSPTPVVDYTPALLGTKGIDLRQAIRDERSRELCFESLRLPDLKRWGILITTIRGLAADINGTNPNYPFIQSIVAEMGNGADNIPMTPVQNVSEKDMFFPIPAWDLIFNAKLTQNLGY
jgi:hypothetical protein